MQRCVAACKFCAAPPAFWESWRCACCFSRRCRLLILCVRHGLLEPLLQLLLYRMVVAVGAAAAELFGTQRLLRLLRGTQQALAIAFALLVCFAVMFIVATAVAMTIGKGGV